MATSEWKDDIDFFLDTKPIENQRAGILCWRGKLHTFGITPKQLGSPFIGKMITLNWRNGVDPDLGLVFDPPLGSPVLLTNEGLQWAITSGSERSGIFELEVESAYLPRKRELTGRLMAENFDDEVTLVFDQMPSPIGRSPLYPCIGAIHQLTLLPNAFSPLQGIEMLWSKSITEPLPQKIEITPNTQTSALVTAGGVRYAFDCSKSSGKAHFKLVFHSLWISSYESSEQLYQLDHNKLKVGAVRQAAIDPVLSKGERAWLEVQYLSWFSGLPASGMPVQWSDSKSLRMQSETDADGWAGHDYEPLEPELIPVEARVVNLYDGGSASQDFEVFALDHDPWQDLDVQTADNPGARTWAETTFFPRRNSQFDFVLSANENSYLRSQQLALGLVGTGPAELALTMGPVTFGQWRPLQDKLPFTLTAGDEKDGGFSFRLAASRLLALSPLNAVSLGAGSRVIKMSAINSSFQVIDWGSVFEAEVTVVSALSGKPIVGMAVVWEGSDLEPVSTTTNFYGVAKVRLTPTIVGLGQVTATAGDDSALQSKSLSYTLNGPREILEMVSPDLDGYPGDEVSASVIVVNSQTGQLLEGVEVDWRFKGLELLPTLTDSQGLASISFKLPLLVGDYALTASVRGGEWGHSAQRLIFTVLADESTWLREFTLWLDGKQVDLAEGKLSLLHEKSYDLELRANLNNSLIGRTSIALEDVSGAEALGLGFVPPLKEQQPLMEGPLHWSISTNAEESGVFELKFSSPDLPDRSLPGQIISVAKELVLHFDSFPMSLGSDMAYPCHGTTHTLTLRPTPTSLFLGMDVRLLWSGEAAGDLGVVITPDLNEWKPLGLEGLTWSLNCLKSLKDGDFSLKLMLRDWEVNLSPLPMSLGHNLVTAEHWKTGPHWAFPDLEYFIMYVRATSVFLKTPAPGVKVTFYDGNPSDTVTGKDGEARARDRSMKIVNRYDGSVV
ncbi:hypothetical protein PMI27_005351 [Pseudomonas sp. GM41(2012)]|uniref:Ig-like domain-containing protein n=1 Tax=Pseudomonas sp. (strain GM41(2012)) TaxID=1144708 RepID=UPI0003E7D777|nr:Ig-like domain-containing protein [Pseudomonas sp. GM41(2012)]EUB71195.1 hypothetical protein PMI27_005351 [Pseudomonas sp. GM41(2012)]